MRGSTRPDKKLYICSPERHAFARAHRVLGDAGYEPEVTRTISCFGTNPLFSGRRKVKELTGNSKVPTLVLDDGTVTNDSANIVVKPGTAGIG